MQGLRNVLYLVLWSYKPDFCLILLYKRVKRETFVGLKQTNVTGYIKSVLLSNNIKS